MEGEEEDQVAAEVEQMMISKLGWTVYGDRTPRDICGTLVYDQESRLRAVHVI